jgi:hypothetical protein
MEERMKKVLGVFTLIAMVVAAIQVVAAQGAQPQTRKITAADKVEIRGWALNFSNTATGANQTIQIRINKWSPVAERDRLIDTFMDKKQDGLASALEKMPEMGRFNFPGYMGPDPNNTMRLGTVIRYAMSTELPEGGRRIVIITPRIIGFREQVNQPRTVDYPFTLFEMHFDKNGKGEGRMAYATKIEFDKKKQAIELENYSSEPVRLNELQLEVKK